MASRPAKSGHYSLSEYRRRRDFNKTPEPPPHKPKTSKRLARPRFCVQKHLASRLHYDLRLEHRGVLLSWAVPKGPSLNPKDKRLAVRVEDHPLDYLGFEGVIPEGYGAGIVMLWDEGTWQPHEHTPDVGRALATGELKFTLRGVKLKGSWVLVRTGGGSRGDGGSEGRSWLLIKHRDEWAGELDIAEFAPKSVHGELDFAEILAQKKPRVWESDQPTRGGSAGAPLRRVIQQAARLLGERQHKRKTPGPSRTGGGRSPAPRRQKDNR